jgi:hypothetical protein
VGRLPLCGKSPHMWEGIPYNILVDGGCPQNPFLRHPPSERLCARRWAPPHTTPHHVHWPHMHHCVSRVGNASVAFWVTPKVESIGMHVKTQTSSQSTTASAPLPDGHIEQTPHCETNASSTHH